ncbi:MAG TPA: STN domain-containing protein [Steroidobacter sp.]|uniref:STN domain-containing protein n=1 Tax=Steroidobacter sp. TaxID=1978227 RepID=UPI002EDAD8B3
MAARSVLAVAFSGVLAPQAVPAADRYPLQIDRQPVVRVLLELSKQTHLQIVGIFPSEPSEGGVLVGPLRGEFTADRALQLLLQDSHLTFVRVNANTVAVMSKPATTTAEVVDDRS